MEAQANAVVNQDNPVQVVKFEIKEKLTNKQNRKEGNYMEIYFTVQSKNNAGGAGPQRAESFLAITKSLIVRALIIYFITSMFRRPQQATDVKSAGGAQIQRYPASNLFANGTVLV